MLRAAGLAFALSLPGIASCRPAAETTDRGPSSPDAPAEPTPAPNARGRRSLAEVRALTDVALRSGSAAARLPIDRKPGARGASGAFDGKLGRPSSEPPPSPERVVTCEASVAGPSATASSSGAACEVSGAGDALIIRGTVLSRAAVLTRGSVRIDAQGRIECVGCGCSDADARVVDCGDAVVSPGLINLHDHITYAGTPPLADTGERYEHRHQWRVGLEGHSKLAYSGSASTAEILAHELRMLMSGVTSLLGAGGEPGLVRNLELPLESGLGFTGIGLATFPLADASGAAARAECAFGARRDDAEKVASLRAYVAHLGEGIDALAQREIACSAQGEYDLFAPSTAVIHAMGVTAAEAALLADSGASVVWSPRSNISLYGNTAPIPLLRRLGVPVALGTDWLASGSMNLLRELSCAEYLSRTRFDGELSAYDLFSMVTFGAALAIGAEHAIGSFDVARAGDVAVFAAREGEGAFDAVVRAEPAAVRLVIRGGAALYGDAELVAALAPDPTLCAELDVCGGAKRACVAADTGVSLDVVRAAGEAVYPLALCTDLGREPTCEPRRPGEYAAISDDDADGDGVPNASDGCPRVFDPPRPLDGGVQADADRDGAGDACDACPLDPSDACFPRAPLDRDRDGIPDAVDACPRTTELEPGDADADGHGDACDHCPSANPGATPCPLSVSALRDPEHAARPPLGSPVALGGWVSAVRADGRGFFLQEAAAPYSGIEVYVARKGLDVMPGERITVFGFFQRYDGRDEVVLDRVERLPTAEPPPAPLDVEAASVADEGALAAAYDGLLVRVVDAEVMRANADEPNDYDETLLEAELRIDDWLYPALDNAFTVGMRLDVTGVLGRSFGHRKLWPRSSEDVTVR